MELAYTLSGAAPVMKKYQVAATNTTIGVPYLIPASNGAGIVLATTTGAADMVGVNVDAAGTFVTGQQSDNSDTARLTTIIINPDAVWRLLMSGGATEGTALTLLPVTTASTTGLAVTTASEWSNPTYDEGTTWGFDGANAGKARKITSVSSTAGTVTVAFPYDTAVGDNFLRCPYNPLQSTVIQLSTLLTQADASIAVGTGAAFKPIELILNDQSWSGRTNSYVLALSGDHNFIAAL